MTPSRSVLFGYLVIMVGALLVLQALLVNSSRAFTLGLPMVAVGACLASSGHARGRQWGLVVGCGVLAFGSGLVAYAPLTYGLLLLVLASYHIAHLCSAHLSSTTRLASAVTLGLVGIQFALVMVDGGTARLAIPTLAAGLAASALGVSMNKL